MSKTSIKDRIRKAGPATKKIPVYPGLDIDLLDEYQRAVADLEAAESPDREAKAAGGDSLESVPNVAERRQRVDQLRTRLDGYRLDLTIRALSDDEWQRVVDAHPPRRGGDDTEADLRDSNSGVNTTTFPGALLRAATIAPELDDEDWDLLLGVDGKPGALTQPQQHEAADEVLRISRHRLSIPFS